MTTFFALFPVLVREHRAVADLHRQEHLLLGHVERGLADLRGAFYVHVDDFSCSCTQRLYTAPICLLQDYWMRTRNKDAMRLVL